MKILFDTNIILDVLLDRSPHVLTAAKLLARVEEGKLQGFICATTITTIHYFSSKQKGRQKAKEQIEQLLKLFDVAAVTRTVLETALELNTKDYEDAVLIAAAHHAGMDAILTHNMKDFKDTPLPVYSPDEFLKTLETL